MEITIIEKNKKNENIYSKKIKVAAYARVSSELEKQITSFESQKKYYTDKINRNVNWVFVNVYSDYGISGTSINKRSQFIDMINDALDGKIDLILTKSISRFARNTVDSLMYVRKLKENNVGIIFEEENINTLDMSGEMLLTILSSVSQQESKNTSERVRFGNYMKMKQGTFPISRRCYGYSVDKNNNTLVIIKEEGEIVKKIFQSYLDGKSTTEIARMLQKNNIKNIRGSTLWSRGTINDMLKNEKYKGDIKQGKSYLDPETKKKVENHGEFPIFYIAEHHEALVSREDFDKVQKRLKMMSDKYKLNKNNYSKIPVLRPFTQKLVCGFCGKIYAVNVEKDKTVYWRCYHGKYSKEPCQSSRPLRNEFITQAFVRCYNRLLEEIYSDDNYFNESLEKINNQIYKKRKMKEKYIIQMSNLVESLFNKEINQYKYKENEKIIENKIKMYEKNEKDLMIEKEKVLEIRKEFLSLKKLLKDANELTVFDEIAFRKLVKIVIIGEKSKNKGKHSPYTIRFIYKNRIIKKIDNLTNKEKILEENTNPKINRYIPIIRFKTKIDCYSPIYKKKNTKNVKISFEIERQL